MLIGKCESIREVIAFPKNNRGADLMSESPAPAEPTVEEKTLAVLSEIKDLLDKKQ